MTTRQLECKLNHMITDLKEICIDIQATIGPEGLRGTEPRTDRSWSVGHSETTSEQPVSELDTLTQRVQRYLEQKSAERFGDAACKRHHVMQKIKLQQSIQESGMSSLDKQKLISMISDQEATVVMDPVVERRSKNRERYEARTLRVAPGMTCKQKKMSRKQRNNHNEIELHDVHPVTQQEQVFEHTVQEKMQEQDIMLETINQGLTEVHELATNAGKQLTVQQGMLNMLDTKIDSTGGKLKRANRTLQEMLESSGGLSRWCPMLMCSMILLGLVGTIFKMF